MPNCATTSAPAPARSWAASTQSVFEGWGLSNQAVVQDLLAQGLSVDGVADRMGLKPTTIIGHVERLIEQEEPVDIGRLLPPERKRRIEEAFKVCGSAFLRPVWEHLVAEYDYDEIRLVRVCLRLQGRLGRE